MPSNVSTQQVTPKVTDLPSPVSICTKLFINFYLEFLVFELLIKFPIFLNKLSERSIPIPKILKIETT